MPGAVVLCMRPGWLHLAKGRHRKADVGPNADDHGEEYDENQPQRQLHRLRPTLATRLPDVREIFRLCHPRHSR